MLRVAVFASGNGSNAINLFEYINSSDLFCFTNLVCDQINAKILKFCKRKNIPNVLIESAGKSRRTHEKELATFLINNTPDIICLAGYMRILSPEFLAELKSIGVKKVLNIHPSLLPKYPGLNGHIKTFESTDHLGGATVHLVNEVLDGGEVVLQENFIIPNPRDFDSFQSLLKECEHRIYPKALQIIGESSA